MAEVTHFLRDMINNVTIVKVRPNIEFIKGV